MKRFALLLALRVAMPVALIAAAVNFDRLQADGALPTPGGYALLVLLPLIVAAAAAAGRMWMLRGTSTASTANPNRKLVAQAMHNLALRGDVDGINLARDLAEHEAKQS